MNWHSSVHICQNRPEHVGFPLPVARKTPSGLGHGRGRLSPGIGWPLKCQPRLGRHRSPMAFWRKPDPSRKSTAVNGTRTGPNGAQQWDADSWEPRKVPGSSPCEDTQEQLGPSRVGVLLRYGQPACPPWAPYASSVLSLTTTNGTTRQGC